MMNGEGLGGRVRMNHNSQRHWAKQKQSIRSKHQHSTHHPAPQTTPTAVLMVAMDHSSLT